MLSGLTAKEEATIKSMRLCGLDHLTDRELKALKFLREKGMKPYDKATILVKPDGGWTVRRTNEEQGEF